MYQEYAIDPTTICRSFDRFKLIWNGLGYSEGRLLSRFPTKWQRKLLKSETYLSLSDGQRSKVREILTREEFSQQKIIASGRSFKPETPTWLGDAERVDTGKPVHAILSEENPREHCSVACYNNIGEEGDCWSTPTPWQIKRCHTDIAKASGPLLKVSREILFIEPYFQFKTRFTRPLKRMLETVNDYEPRITRIEIHLKEGNPPDGFDTFLDGFEHDLRNKLQDCCTRPCDVLLDKLEFFIWDSPDDNRMHPRYILTDVSGLGFENGLDEDPTGGTFTDVSRIAGVSKERRWAEFQTTSATRTLIKTFKATDFT